MNAEELSARMSKRLASYRLPDAAIKRLANRVVIDGLEIGRFYPCIYGICVDYWTNEPPRFELDAKSGVSKWEVFPYGIIDWDHFKVRVAFEVSELDAGVPPRGFHN
ncbi:MAG TPA: hypothetical protein VHF89_02650 [Solirubrobacteraceae bacterium]|nr:hypothetical protein [Solirubrobacteraceae bacterium]